MYKKFFSIFKVPEKKKIQLKMYIPTTQHLGLVVITLLYFFAYLSILGFFFSWYPKLTTVSLQATTYIASQT